MAALLKGPQPPCDALVNVGLVAVAGEVVQVQRSASRTEVGVPVGLGGSGEAELSTDGTGLVDAPVLVAKGAPPVGREEYLNSTLVRGAPTDESNFQACR